MRRPPAWTLGAFLCLISFGVPDAYQAPARAEFPAKGAWQTRDAALLGLDKVKLDEAVSFAIQHESTTDKDLAKATTLPKNSLALRFESRRCAGTDIRNAPCRGR